MSIDDTHLDRLVDDELSEEERRELLGELDEEPGGWRRCALAFLEAQCWRQVFGEMPSVRDSLRAILQPATRDAGGTPALRGETPTLDKQTAAPRRAVWLGRAKVLSAMAASFLAAMWLGNVAQHAWVAHWRTPGGPNLVALAPNDQGISPLPTPDDRGSRLVSLPLQAGGGSSPWRVVTVSSSSDGQQPRSAIEVPAVERANIDEQWLRSVPPAIPENVLQALARTGHQIEQQREFVPVPLKDGRQLIVPVDRVKVHYVGNGPY